MKFCNLCGKIITGKKDVNIEIGIWENVKDGDCIATTFLWEELHPECAKRYVSKTKKEIPILKPSEVKKTKHKNKKLGAT